MEFNNISVKGLLLKFITLATLVFCLLLPVNCFSITHQEYFAKYLEPTSVMLDSLYFKGPISYELGKRALGRQVLEDGIFRRPNSSVAGISIGEPNKSIVMDTLKNTNIKIGRAQDSEGGTFYSFDGDSANIYSSLIIARLFDTYINKFLKKDKKQWFMAKETSKAICQEPDSFELNHRFHTLKPEKIIEKCCGLYGPGKGAVDDIIKRSVNPLSNH